MICPHCGSTIREEQRYLMSRDPTGGAPKWLGWVGGVILAALILALPLHYLLTLANG